MSHQLPIIVITSKSTSRSETIVRDWQEVAGVDLIIVPGVYLIEDNQIAYDTRVFKLLQGRPMSLSEIGCAEAHNFARKKIARSQFGGIIFEDDARVNSIEEVLDIAHKFLKDNQGRNSLLNLCESSQNSAGKNFPSRIVKLMGNSPLAVAYVLTKGAAEELVSKNSPVSWVSDWPVSKVDHFIVVPPLVSHGDQDSFSEIAIASESGDLRHIKFKVITFKNFFFPFRLAFGNNRSLWKHFLYFIYLAPIYWRIDKIKIRFIKCIKC